MLNKLKKASKKTIGTKQTLRAIQQEQAKLVFIARDAEEHVVLDVVQLCQKKDITPIYVDNMEELGEACGIQVGAASAAILRQ